jgi:hypothetical protein
VQDEFLIDVESLLRFFSIFFSELYLLFFVCLPFFIFSEQAFIYLFVNFVLKISQEHCSSFLPIIILLIRDSCNSDGFEKNGKIVFFKEV